MKRFNTNWLASIFQYMYEVIVAADRPIFMAAMVLLPFIAPLLPAMITADNLRKYLFPEHPNWSLIGVIAFELVAMLSQVAVVSANMNLKEDPNNAVLKAEAQRASLSYIIYILTLISGNVLLEIANGVSFVKVFTVACLTVGLSFSSSLVNAGRIHQRDAEDKKLQEIQREQERQDALRREEQERQDKIRREREQMRFERWKLKNGYALQQFALESSDVSLQQFPNSFETKSKPGRPSEHETAVFAFIDNYYTRYKKAPTFNEVFSGVQGVSRGTISKLRNRWITERRWEAIDSESGGVMSDGSTSSDSMSD